MDKIAHFFTDNKYISFLEYKSIYSFWLQHRDWQFYIYNCKHSTDPTPEENNYYDNVLAFSSKTFEVDFRKLKNKRLRCKNSSTVEVKKKTFEQYIMTESKGYWLTGDKFYFFPLDKHEGYHFDNTVDITDDEHLDFNSWEGRLLSLLRGSFVIDAMIFYTLTGNVLDIGCGDKALLTKLPNKEITTVDSFEPFNPDVLWDLNNLPLPFEDNSYDTVFALDLIEHLEKDKGEKLLDELKRIAKKRILLLTPLWWDDNTHNVTNPNSPYFGNEHDKHLSLWGLKDFKDWERLIALGNLTHYFFGLWEKKEQE